MEVAKNINYETNIIEKKYKYYSKGLSINDVATNLTSSDPNTPLVTYCHNNVPHPRPLHKYLPRLDFINLEMAWYKYKYI